MPDEQTTVDETTTPTPQASSAPTPETGKDGQPFDAARAQSTIETLRAEMRALKAQAKEAETLKARVNEFEREKLSETERQAAELADLKAQNAALKAAHQDALIRSAVEREAVKAGAIDPDVVYALVDRSAVVLADDGVTGADKAVKALLDAKPYLVGKKADEQPGGAGAARSTPTTPKPNGRPTAEDDQRMREQSAAHWHSRF